MRELGATRREEAEALAAGAARVAAVPRGARAHSRRRGTRGWKLAILSNTDRDFIDASLERIGVPFDLAIVAVRDRLLQAGPAALAAVLRAERRDRARARPRRAEPLPRRRARRATLGLRSIWINRYGEEHEPAPTRELARPRRALPETLDELVAA